MLPGMRSRVSLTAVALPLLLAACATGSQGGSPFETGRGSRQIHIKIRNQNFYDATIWAVVRDARQRKLGTVTGKQDASFTLSWSISEPLQLDIDLVGGNMRCRTQPLTVDPGDIVELQITADFGQMRGCGMPAPNP